MLGEHRSPAQIAVTGILPQALVVGVFAIALAMDADWGPVELVTVIIACTGLVLLSRIRVLAVPTGRAEDRLDPRALHSLARRTHMGSVGPIDGLAIDRALVGSLLGNGPLGLYSVAFAFGGLTNILGMCLAMVAMPQIARLQQSPEEEGRLVRRAVVLAAAVLTGVVVALELVLEPAIRLTFGADFTGALECARWVVVASGLLAFRRVLIAVLQGRGHGGSTSIVELALTPFVIVGVVLAAVADSLVGVGITMAVVGAVACVVLGVLAARSQAAGAVTTVPNPDVAR